MFSFLQGFAYGLFVSCLPWFMAGMINPRLALPNDSPRRWQVFVRYGFAIPFIVFLTWITSLWGGFEPSLMGWLAGLLAVPAGLFIERRWLRWRSSGEEKRRTAELDRAAARQREALEREERESGLRVLDPAQPPSGADDIVRSLCAVKQRLLDARRPDLAMSADRIYTRYAHVSDVISAKFDPREMTHSRASGLVSEVCLTAIDKLESMASLAHGTVSIDTEFVRRRLQHDRQHLSIKERGALERRLLLVADSERRLKELGAGIEAALTALDDAAVAVSSVETARPQAAVATDQALHDLRRFVDRAQTYSRST